MRTLDPLDLSDCLKLTLWKCLELVMTIPVLVFKNVEERVSNWNSAAVSSKENFNLINNTHAVIPLSTLTPPTAVHSSDQSKAFYWLVCEGHVTNTVSRRLKSPDLETAFSSTSQCGTEHLLHRSESTRSTRWSPIWSQNRRQHFSVKWHQILNVFS